VKRPGFWVGVGVVTAIVVGFTSVYLFTQTVWGRDQVLTFTLERIGGRFNGDLDAERLEGNVITGALIHGIVLTDTTGTPLATVDSAFIQYRAATFVGGDVVINRLVVYGANLNIFRMPGDTLWNFEFILQDPTPSPTESMSATLVEELEIRGAQVTLRAPLRPDPRLSPARQEEVLAEIRADPRYMLEDVPGGTLQTTIIDVAQAGVRELFIGPDERGGTYLEVDSAMADVRLWSDPPLEVRNVQASLHLREGIVNYRAPLVQLANSRGESVGRIDISGERPLYDVVITTPEFAFSDLRWLYPWLPEDPADGGGSARLWVEDREEGLAVVSRDVVLDMPGTHVTGRFGMVVDPEAIHFVDVDLEAEPLRIESVEQLLPEDLPVEGLIVGGATIRGES
jgi:hypothetical protein